MIGRLFDVLFDNKTQKGLIINATQFNFIINAIQFNFKSICLPIALVLMTYFQKQLKKTEWVSMSED